MPRGNIWNIKRIKEGFESFYIEHGHYPTTHEIDSYNKLPSARTIMRLYGGLTQFRKESGQEIFDYRKGELRSIKAATTYSAATKSEETFYNTITQVIHPILVHEHKIIRPGNVCCDFFIYTDSDAGIVIDIFYADSIRNLGGILNIKLKRYELINPDTQIYLVCTNKIIDQGSIDKLVLNKKQKVPDNIFVVGEMFFTQNVITSIAQRKGGLNERFQNGLF